MEVRFWGTRGSVASPGPDTVRYGGNTSCVELRTAADLLILDCGTGARALGARLASDGLHEQVHLLLTHFHWDHIQGFPFFFPVFTPGTEVQVYGAAGLEHGLEEALAGQMQHTYFPVRLGELQARIQFHEVGEDVFSAGQALVRSHYLNHTCPTVGYRVSIGSTTVAYITDHEPFWPPDPDAPLSQGFAHPGDQQHARFVEGADLLIHDSQYTAEEYPARRGWGHSPVEYVVDVAVSAGVQRLALFHHDPARTDEALDALLERAHDRVRRRGAQLEVFAASEGQVLELPEDHPSPARRALPTVVAGPSAPARVALIGSPERRRTLREALVEDGYWITERGLDAAPEDWIQAEPDLLLVAPPADDHAGSLLSQAHEIAGDRPVIAILEGVIEHTTLRDLARTAADVVVAPFGLPNLRARVRACLARKQALPRPSRATDQPLPMDTMGLTDRLPSADLEVMLRAASPFAFKPGDVLFREGDPSRGVYYVRSGLLRLTVQGEDGVDVIIGFVGPGDTVGEMSALDGAPRSANAVAVEPVEASYVSPEAFKHAVERSPETSMRLLRLFVRRLREADSRLAVSRPGRTAEPGAVTLTDLESALEIELDRARRLRYPLGMLVSQVVSNTESGTHVWNGESPMTGVLRTTLRRGDVLAKSDSGDLTAILPGVTPEQLPAVRARVEAALRDHLRSASIDATVGVAASMVDPQEETSHHFIEQTRLEAGRRNPPLV